MREDHGTNALELTWIQLTKVGTGGSERNVVPGALTLQGGAVLQDAHLVFFSCLTRDEDSTGRYKGHGRMGVCQTVKKHDLLVIPKRQRSPRGVRTVIQTRE
jgi:hypothetical protein